MAKLYADENFPFAATGGIRLLGHGVLTAFEAGRANQSIPDPAVLQFADSQQRAVLTQDKDYKKLHRQVRQHSGIVLSSADDNFTALAQRISDAISANLPLDGKLVRVYRPAKSTP